MKLNLIKIICYCLFCFASHFALGNELDEQSKSAKTFICAGLWFYDTGNAAKDGVLSFYNASTNELVCTAAMGNHQCVKQSQGENCQCAPIEWKANDCWKKYNEWLKQYKDSKK